jgi:SAM-dependent methyltransferase
MEEPAATARPARADPTAYARYLAGMDASMRQKVALTAAHLLCEGRVADMGMGSGRGSDALAALYPRLEVVGVDLDPRLVERARREFTRPNLSFACADIARAAFPAASLDGVLDSSVLHHVTSFGGYRHDAAAEALAAQAAQLKAHGVLVVRDFLDPGPRPVWLDVPADDGEASGEDPRRASSAALLERFAREFRSLSAAPGFPLEAVDPRRTGGSGVSGTAAPPPRPGWRRYRLQHKHAVEFVLRKDYRADWEAEVQEEYTYYTQRQFEELFARLGLRILASIPLLNPWIVRHRFEGRFDLWDLDGRALPFPATNYVIVGEKVGAGEGVRFRVASAAPPLGFLRLEQHRERASGRVRDLAARPHATVDVVPYFAAGGAVYVLARTSYPRPVMRAGHDEAPPLDGSGPCDYVAEPLAVIQTDEPLGQTVESALARAAGMDASVIRRMEPGTTYYPSPGGILEEVRSVFVEIEPSYVNAPLEPVSGFSTSGRVRAIEARQLLRAAQVGGLPDARLELNVHDLLLRSGMDRGPWIGDEIDGAGALRVEAEPLAPRLARPGRRAFERAAAGQSPGFLELRCDVFEELDAGGAVVARGAREYVVPRALGPNTVAVALLARTHDGAWALGVDEDDLPAAQSFCGNSNLLVAPAWRLPRGIGERGRAIGFVAERLGAEYGLEVAAPVELGGPYRPSPGLTPEIVFPWAFIARSQGDGARPLLWVRLDDLVTLRDRVSDGHLRVVSLRASHLLGVGG